MKVEDEYSFSFGLGFIALGLWFFRIVCYGLGSKGLEFEGFWVGVNHLDEHQLTI